jgi:hypothetical protein
LRADCFPAKAGNAVGFLFIGSQQLTKEETRMEPKVIRIEIKVNKTMIIVLAGLLLALTLLAVTSVGARPPLEGPGGQGGVIVASTVPTMISYQGQLLDRGGNLVPDGTYSMTFKLYDASIGGNLLWSETQSVTVTNGLFNVMLGAARSLDGVDFLGESYLEVGVNGQVLSPRQQMVSVPYAFRAANADKLQGEPDWDGACTGIMHTHCITDKVGIGTVTPSHPLTVRSGGFQDAIRTLKEPIPGGEWGVVIGAASPEEGNGGRIFGYNPAIGPSSDNAEGWVDLFINSFGRHTILNLHYGNVGIGTTNPQSTLQVEGSPGYLQIDWITTSPNPADCTVAHIGRMILQDPTSLWACTSAGWKYAELQP